MVINVATAVSSSGYQYHLDEDDIRTVFNIKHVRRKFDMYKNCIFK